MDNSSQAPTITALDMLNIPDIRRRRDSIAAACDQAEDLNIDGKINNYCWIGERAPSTIADIDALLAFIDGEQARHVAAITAAEQRGRVAGLIAARDAMCLDCRQGSKPILDRRRGEWEHWPDSSFSWTCHAGAIHALIAEEAQQ